jgi:uncharacterized protein (TIGR02145 family)
MTRIFIENQELDINDQITNQISYAIDDLKNLDSKATSFTKTIVIPGTSNNNNLFGNIFEFGNANVSSQGANVFYNFDATRSAQARIEVNGLEAIRGVLRLLKIIHDGDRVEYEVALFGELSGLVSQLANSRLEDLDLSEFNHVYNSDAVLDSWTAFEDSTFIYDLTGLTINFTASVPGGFIRVNFLLYDSLDKLNVGSIIKVTDSSNNNGTYTINNIVRQPSLKRVIIGVNETIVNETDANGIKIEILNRTIGNGYVYPLINYGNVTYNYPSSSPTFFKYKDWQITAFRPAVYVKTYFDKIMNAAGYTYESDFINSNFFKKLIIPHNEAAFYNRDASVYVDASGTITGSASPDNNPNYLIYLKHDVSATLNSFAITSVSNPSGIQSGSSLLCSSSVSLNVKVTARVDGNYSAYIPFDDGSYQLQLRKNTEVLATYDIQRTPELGAALAPIYVSLTGNASVQLGDRINFVIAAINSNDANVIRLNVDSFITVENNPPGYVVYDIGDTVNMNYAIPRNIFQRDFLTSLFKMFNLMIVQDSYKERHLIIEPDLYFYNINRTSYIDWSDKVDRSQVITIQPMSEANARYYEFKYKDDSDYYNDDYKKKYNQGYGTRIFENPIEFSKDSQKLEVIFSPTVLTGFAEEDKIFPTICKINNSLEESIGHNIRILTCDLIKDVASYKILNIDTVLETVTEYLYAGHLNNPYNPFYDLNFGAPFQLYFDLDKGNLSNNGFNIFYYPYMAEITSKDSRLVTCTMKLNEIDIFQLDWTRFVYLDGVLYRLKRIIDWTADNTCKVELLRVINTTYLDPGIYYNTGLIGNQMWMTQNFKEKSYNNGDPIPFAASEADWLDYAASETGCYAYFKYDTADGQYGDNTDYGLYYNQFALKDSRGLLPDGWRLPTRQDFIDLDTETGGNALKGNVEWAAGNTNTNTTGSDGILNDENTKARYWSSTAFDSDETYYMELGYATDTIKTNSYGRNYDGYNVRLIKI